jgi:hypothetical protein
MAIFIRKLLLAHVIAASAWAQIDMLSAREAEQILDLVPSVAEAKARGECPAYSIAYPRAAVLSIQVRGACQLSGFAGSMLINNYVVSRATGAVTVGIYGETSNPPVADPQMLAAAAELLRKARARKLSPAQASCLASVAARSYLGVGSPKGRANVSQVGQPSPRESRFYVSWQHPGLAAVSGAPLTVDLTNGGVRDDDTGMPIASDEVGLLTARMTALSEAPTLSAADVVTIAATVPEIASRIADRCHELVSSQSGPSNIVYVALQEKCGKGPAELEVVAGVDITTGKVTNPRTGKGVESEQTTKTARDLIEGLEARHHNLQTAVANTCGQISMVPPK